MEPTGKSIEIAGLELGAKAPVRIQSMCTTDTNEVEASVAQCIRMIEAGAELVRLTTQGSREVKSIARVREALRAKGYATPVVADIHFRPTLALEAAGLVDKIRINPGNYLKGAAVEGLLPQLLFRCKEQGTALRIGVNHGSLAPEILEEFGDTPQGMVESAMRFLRVCHKEGMEKVVVSMKSSNPRVMIQSVRLLAAQMESEGLSYPIHLGVTEAGDGMEGRIKSVVGMAPLLLDGLGDTIRVSLTEAPENELPVARLITELFPRNKGFSTKLLEGLAWDPYSFRRRRAAKHGSLGGASRVKLVSKQAPVAGEDLHPSQLRKQDGLRLFSSHEGSLPQIRQAISAFCKADTQSPILFRHVSRETDPLRYRLQLAGELGYLLVDGYLDAVWAENPHFDEAFINDALLHILQAAGARMSKTEYIACPSCGRTHFDILERLKEIREATAHLKPLKIGVMGCIVNGPGEMADADYGYVGAGQGKVSLYRGKVPVEENLPEEQALDALIALIKREGDWVEH